MATSANRQIHHDVPPSWSEVLQDGFLQDRIVESLVRHGQIR